MIFRENHKYEVQSKISDEIFQQFLQYLINGTETEIYFDTIYELNQLSKEFQINELQEKIEKKRKQWREIENYFDQQPPNQSQTAADYMQDTSEINQKFSKFVFNVFFIFKEFEDF